MYDFINRPIPRLLRYDLLLKEIHKMTAKEGLDTDEVQQVLDELHASAATVDKAVEDAQRKIELWNLKDILTVASDSKMNDSVVRVSFAVVPPTKGSILTSLLYPLPDLRPGTHGRPSAAHPKGCTSIYLAACILLRY